MDIDDPDVDNTLVHVDDGDLSLERTEQLDGTRRAAKQMAMIAVITKAAASWSSWTCIDAIATKFQLVDLVNL